MKEKFGSDGIIPKSVIAEPSSIRGESIPLDEWHKEELEKKLTLLPKKYETLLLLRYKDDLSLAEIADVLNLPYNTVKSRHQRALATLKDIFLHP